MKKLLLILALSISTIFIVNSQTLDPFSNSKKDRLDVNLQAYPNPLITHTTLTFESASSEIVTLRVRNLLGKTVYIEKFTPRIGRNSILFYKNNLESGMYIYSLQTTTKKISKRLVIK